MNLLIAGFGNVLREDDAFGVRLLERLRQTPLPDGVRLLEAGIGGISLVQDLLDNFDALIVLDALEGNELEGDTVGTVRVLEANVMDPRTLPARAARDVFADLHYAEPGRAMALARALGHLPERAFIVGCVIKRSEIGIGMSLEVEAALEEALARTLGLIETLHAPVGV